MLLLLLLLLLVVFAESRNTQAHSYEAPNLPRGQPELRWKNRGASRRFVVRPHEPLLFFAFAAAALQLGL